MYHGCTPMIMKKCHRANFCSINSRCPLHRDGVQQPAQVVHKYGISMGYEPPTSLVNNECSVAKLWTFLSCSICHPPCSLPRWKIMIFGVSAQIKMTTTRSSNSKFCSHRCRVRVLVLVGKERTKEGSSSVTRWLNYFKILGHLQQKNLPNSIFLPK